MNFEISIEKFMDALPIMGKGMLGIFLVTLVIVGVVYLLNVATRPKK